MKATFVFALFACFYFCGTTLGKSVEIGQNASDKVSRQKRQLDFLSWLFGEKQNAFRSEPTNHIHNSSWNETNLKPNGTSFRIGPFIITDIKNSNLKRANLTPEFEKGLRDEIYKNNQEHSRALLTSTSTHRSTSSGKLEPSTRHLRFKRRSNAHHSSHGGLNGRLISKRQAYFGGMTPQQEMLLLQQQAALQQQQQQQLYGLSGINSIQNPLTNQLYETGTAYGNVNRRRRPYFDDDDYDDDDSDEFDDFDSDEFMSFPIRAGFMPSNAFGGFRGR